MAPPSRLRDRDVHDRRNLRPSGLPGRRGPDHRRCHAVDDRWWRHLAHRDASGGARCLRRLVPRHPALGEPAGQGQDDPARLPGARGRRRGTAVFGRRWRSPADDRRRHRWPPWPRLDPYAHGAVASAGVPRGPARAPLEAGIQRSRLHPGRIGAGRQRRRDRSEPVSWRRSARAIGSLSEPTMLRTRGPTISRSSSSAASRSESQSSITGLSS